MEQIEKILVEIQRLKKELDGYTASEGLDHIESYINLIRREYSLPSNIDEAAHNYAWEKQEHHIDFDGDEYLDYGTRYDAFKAGAEWMARQGSSFKVNVEEVPQGHWYAGFHLGRCAEEEENALKSINAKDGEEVIVQIRKK